MNLVTYWANCSAVGDTVCTIPIIKALIKERRLYRAIVPPKFYELYVLCDIPEELIVPLTGEEVKTAFDPKGSTVVTANAPGRAAYRMHLLDLFSVFSVNAILKPEEKEVKVNTSKLPNYKIRKPYIVVGVGYAVQSRKMPVKIFKEIVSHAEKRGYAVVLLGGQRPNSKNPIIFEDYPTDGCIDLINKTTFAESLSIMNGAACVIGMDSGLTHLASLTDVPIVCGYTYVDPYYRAPFRNGFQDYRYYAVEPRGPCKYCSNGLAMFGVEFDHSCPLGRGYECVTSLEAEDFISNIERAIISDSPVRVNRIKEGYIRHEPTPSPSHSVAFSYDSREPESVGASKADKPGKSKKRFSPAKGRSKA